jgi:excisionase family DNA binding protein
MSKKPIDPANLTTRQAATVIGCCEKILREKLLSRGVPHFRIGSRLLFPRDLLQNWINEQAVNHVAQIKDGANARANAHN